MYRHPLLRTQPMESATAGSSTVQNTEGTREQVGILTRIEGLAGPAGRGREDQLMSPCMSCGIQYVHRMVSARV